MSLPRIDFTDLPPAVRQAATRRTGPIRLIRPVGEAGRHSAVAAVLAIQAGPVFVKGVPVGHRLAASQRREAAVAPHLPALAPCL